MSIILALLVIVVCLLMLGATSQPHMLNPEHPKIRHPRDEKINLVVKQT